MKNEKIKIESENKLHTSDDGKYEKIVVWKEDVEIQKKRKER